MRFLLRLAFWFAVIAILLPGSGSEPTSNVQINATSAVSAAQATVGDMERFCDRQPDACTVGSEAAVALTDRAKAGARRIFDFFNKRLANGDPGPATTASAGTTARSVPLPPARPPQSASRSTLKPADLVPAWRGLPRKDGRDAA
jgi:hypothetical protein